MSHKYILGFLILLLCNLVQADGCKASKAKLVADFPLNFQNSKAVGFQPDGKSIVARIKLGQEDGVTVNEIAIERFLCEGQKDFTFAESGILKSDVHPTHPRNMVQVTKEGKILVAGSDGVRLRRYTEEGFLDNTFGSEGKVEGAFTLKEDREMKNDTVAIRLQKSGKILVAGNATRSLPPYNVLYFLARFNSDGTVDKTFGNNGKIIDGESEKNTPEITVENVLSDSEGNIYLVGTGVAGETKKSVVMHKFDKNGAHVKGPVHYAIPDPAKSSFQIKDSILAQDAEVVVLAERIASDSKLAKPALVKFSADLEPSSAFQYEPKRGLASGSYAPVGIAALPSGYVLTMQYEEPSKPKTKEMQIVKVDFSGHELIRVTEEAASPLNELPVRLLEEPSGKYSLLASGSQTFNAEGLEYILLKFMP